MKLTIDRRGFADALKKASKFLPRHMALPAVQNFHLDAHSGIVVLTATNLDAGIRVELDAKIEEQGTILVAPSLARVVAGSKAERIQLAASDTHLTISAGPSTWKLPLHTPLEDYPVTEPAVSGEKLPIENWDHIRAVATIAHKPDQSRPVLEGVLFSEGRAVATDNYRLAHVQASSVSEHPEALVPAVAILAIEEEITAVEISDRHLYARTGDGAFWTRLIEGKFPAWRNLAKGFTSNTKVKVGASELADAVARSGLVADDHLPLFLEAEADGLVRVRLTGATEGEVIFDEALACATEGDMGVKIAFNPTYLRSVLAPITSATLEFHDPGRMAKVTGDGWWEAWIMSVRI